MAIIVCKNIMDIDTTFNVNTKQSKNGYCLLSDHISKGCYIKNNTDHVGWTNK